MEWKAGAQTKEAEKKKSEPRLWKNAGIAFGAAQMNAAMLIKKELKKEYEKNEFLCFWQALNRRPPPPPHAERRRYCIKGERFVIILYVSGLAEEQRKSATLWEIWRYRLSNSVTLWGWRRLWLKWYKLNPRRKIIGHENDEQRRAKKNALH